MAGGRLLQQLVELLALVGVEGAEHVVLGHRQRALRLLEALRAVLREVDDVAAAVLDGAPPRDQPIGLELVEQADEVGPVDVQLGGERLLGGAAMVAQQRERDEVARAQSEWVERGLGAQAREPREVVQECRGAVGVDRRGRDATESSARFPMCCMLSFVCQTQMSLTRQPDDQAPQEHHMTPLDLTGDIATAVDGAVERGPSFVLGYTGDDGTAVLSFRGSLKVHSAHQLELWSRKRDEGLVEAVAERPQVSLLYYSTDTPGPKYLSIRGRARVAEELNDRVYDGMVPAEQAQDPERKGVALIIDVDSVQGFGDEGGFLQERAG